MAGENTPASQLEDDPTPEELEPDETTETPEPEQKPAAENKPADPYAGLAADERALIEACKKAGLSAAQMGNLAARGWDVVQAELQAAHKDNQASGGKEDSPFATTQQLYDALRKMGDITPKMVQSQIDAAKLEALLDMNPDTQDDARARKYVDEEAKKLMKQGLSPKQAFQAAHKDLLDWQGEIKQKSIQKKIAAQKTRGETRGGSSASDLPAAEYEHKEDDFQTGKASKDFADFMRKQELQKTR